MAVVLPMLARGSIAQRVDDYEAIRDLTVGLEQDCAYSQDAGFVSAVYEWARSLEELLAHLTTEAGQRLNELQQEGRTS